MNLIRLSKSSVGKEEKAAISNVIDIGSLGMGSEVNKFEEDLKLYLGNNLQVVCVNSGTAALHLAVESIIEPGDEVLVPSITYVASHQAISAASGIPISCEVREDNIFIDTKDAEKRITEKTKAIMPVHFASDSQDINEVYELAQKYNLRVIEDAAHGFSCYRDNKIIGSSGDIICFSFDGIKNITCGEGGAIVTNDERVISYCKDSRLLGVEKDTEARFAGKRSWDFEVHNQGWRYHMSNINAAIGIEQLKKINKFRAMRQYGVNYYLSNLKEVKEINFLNLDYQNITQHVFVLKILNGQRDQLISYLKKNNIESGIHYKPNHLLEKFKTNYELQISEKLGDQLISIPLHAELKDNELSRVVETIKSFFINA